jgi:hypothetical protein
VVEGIVLVGGGPVVVGAGVVLGKLPTAQCA